MDPAQTSRSKVRRNLLHSEVKDHTDRLNVQRQTDRQGGRTDRHYRHSERSDG